jgi:hypothetical protein
MVAGCAAPAKEVPPAGLSATITVQAALPSVTIRPSSTFTPTAVPSPTVTRTIAPTQTSIPPALELFNPRLGSGVLPATYLKNTCEYLSLRWKSGSAAPGTVVVPIMYHGVRNEGGSLLDNVTVTESYFLETMKHAQDLGFETITSEQLADFLQQNSYIPPRSMILIIDDRRLGTVRNHFLPVLEKNGWTLTMGYITGIINDREWDEIKQVLASGRVEIQPHGFMHNGATYFTEFTSDEIIHQEIYEPIEAFKEHLGIIPSVFIWPGGNFTAGSVAEVQKAGYSLAFSAYARGPLMFNWIPLGELERSMDSPLYVLPRYWSTAAYINLDDAVRYADQAREFALQQQPVDFEYYNTYCSGYPAIDSSVLAGNEGNE